jgi:hypothetical protein
MQSQTSELLSIYFHATRGFISQVVLSEDSVRERTRVHSNNGALGSVATWRTLVEQYVVISTENWAGNVDSALDRTVSRDRWLDRPERTGTPGEEGRVEGCFQQRLTIRQSALKRAQRHSFDGPR